MFGKNLVLELCSKMLSANQIAGFFKLEYLRNRMTYQPDFLHVKSYQFWLQIDHGIFAKYTYMKWWAWPGTLRHAQGELKLLVFNISTMTEAIVLIFCK